MYCTVICKPDIGMYRATQITHKYLENIVYFEYLHESLLLILFYWYFFQKLPASNIHLKLKCKVDF